MSGPNYIRNAGQDAAKAVGYNPYDVQAGGIGSVSFRPGGVDVTTDPRLAEQSRLLAAVNQQNLQAAPQAAQQAGRFAGNAADVSQQLLTQAGQFDPLAAAESRFQKLQSALAPSRQRQEAALQEQLFRQGRGNSGVANQQTAEQQAAYRLADVQALNSMYGEAQQQQNQAIQTGLQAGASGYTVGQGQFQQALQGTEAGLNLAKQPLGLATVGQALGANETSADAARNTAISQYNQSQAGTGGGGGISAALGVAGGLAGAYLVPGPAGAMAGAQLGSQIGSFF